MLICTFAGHREILHSGIDTKLAGLLEKLMEMDDDFQFYVGGMGEFDALCAREVRRLKARFPEKTVRLALVLPAMRSGLERYAAYDEIIIPEESASQHYKRAITVRNRWMAVHSQYLIAYVHREFGGAYDMVRFAVGAGVEVWNLGLAE